MRGIGEDAPTGRSRRAALWCGLAAAPCLAIAVLAGRDTALEGLGLLLSLGLNLLMLVLLVPTARPRSAEPGTDPFRGSGQGRVLPVLAKAYGAQAVLAAVAYLLAAALDRDVRGESAAIVIGMTSLLGLVAWLVAAMVLWPVAVATSALVRRAQGRQVDWRAPALGLVLVLALATAIAAMLGTSGENSLGGFGAIVDVWLQWDQSGGTAVAAWSARALTVVLLVLLRPLVRLVNGTPDGRS